MDPLLIIPRGTLFVDVRTDRTSLRRSDNLPHTEGRGGRSSATHPASLHSLAPSPLVSRQVGPPLDMSRYLYSTYPRACATLLTRPTSASLLPHHRSVVPLVGARPKPPALISTSSFLFGQTPSSHFFRFQHHLFHSYGLDDTKHAFEFAGRLFNGCVFVSVKTEWAASRRTSNG